VSSYLAKQFTHLPIVPFRGFSLPSTGYALAFTSNYAFAWDYTSPTGPPKTHTLPLPFNLKPTDPLPLGAIVRNGTSNEFGILAVAPSTGKVAFLENVESAEARSHFPQRHRGVEGSVGKLSSGETIIDLVDVDNAGYMLVFSSGRLMQLVLRDAQGRPHITVFPLQTANPTSSSFFSFKGLLGGAIQKPVSLVKARPSMSKGQMEVITATKNGIFQTWDLNYSGNHIFKREIDVHEELLHALLDGAPVESQAQNEVHILDFAIMQHQGQFSESQISTVGFQQEVDLLLLVVLSGPNSLEYSLVEVDLATHENFVSRVIPLRCFHQPKIPKDLTGTLLLPSPGHSAIIQLGSAVVVCSLAQPEQSPDTQLQLDSGKAALPYQDTIYFHEDRHVRFVGSGLQHALKKDRTSSAIFFVQGFGLIQVSAFGSKGAIAPIGGEKVTALDKLTQATFFSSLPGNIIDFSIKSRYSFGQEEVEHAAMEISTGIMTSSFEYIQTVTSSIEDQIRKRCGALRNLVTHLRSDYPPLSFNVKWQLLWDGEKLAAALQLWKRYDERCQKNRKSPTTHEKPLLPELVAMLNERYKTELDESKGETDEVRQYFLKDLHRLQVILPWAWHIFRLSYLERSSKDPAVLMQRLEEADDILLVVFETAFHFREENIELYGLDGDSLENGVLKPNKGADALPEFWTSTHNNVHATRHLVDIGRALAIEHYENQSSAHLANLAKKIAADNPRLVKICCQLHIERFRWCLEQSDERKRTTGRELETEFNTKVRPQQIFSLVELGLAEDGMNLAETYNDMPTLARVIWEETKYILGEKETTTSKIEKVECEKKLKLIKERIKRYFVKYGDKWADAYYSKYISEHALARMLRDNQQHQGTLTKFLRADPSRGRLGWINEIDGENNYKAAAQTLLKVAKHQESNDWCKKIELSIATLALECEEPEESQQVSSPDLPKEIEDERVLVAISDNIHAFLNSVTVGALDEDSALQLAMEEFGQGILAERPALQQLLQQGFENLVHHRVLEPALLIDILTLIDYDPTRNEYMDYDLPHHEFYMAFQALIAAWQDMDPITRESTLKIVWKRLYLQDNWEELNDTSDLGDQEVRDRLAGTKLGWTLQRLRGAHKGKPTVDW